MTVEERPRARVAALLRGRRKDIIETWMAVERQRNEELQRVDDEALVDSMPRMLDELAAHLESHDEDARFDIPTIDTAVEHGAQRVRLQMPLELLLEEYAILRRVVTGMLREDARMSDEELEQFHALLDSAMRSSAVAHAQAHATARDRIVGIVSHDLRNPLNAIVLGTQTVLELSRDNPMAKRLLERVLASSERALRMIVDLLDYSNSTAGAGIPIHPREVDLVALVEDVLDEVRASAPGRNITFTTEVRPLDGRWDPDRVEQVVGNLLRNALQYSSTASTVAVRAFFSPACEACVEVHNEGPAIDPAQLPHLFEPFRRGRTAAGVAGNVGLGLFIANEVVRAHGGSIDVRSIEGDGTTFTVRLPR